MVWVDVVLEDEVCARATPVIIARAVVTARKNLIMSCSPWNCLQAEIACCRIEGCGGQAGRSVDCVGRLIVAQTTRTRRGQRCPLLPSSFVRKTVGGRGVFVGKLAMFMSRGCVLLGVFVLAEIVEMGRLKVMMRGGLVVSGRQMVRFTRRVLR